METRPPASNRTFWRLTPLWAALLVGSTSPLLARQIMDMAGRCLNLPDKITRIYGASPYTNVLAYMVAPELLIDSPVPGPDPSQRFIRSESGKLPLPKAHAPAGDQKSRGPGVEAILAMKPDFVLLKGNPRTDHAGAKKFEPLGIPVVYVDLDEIDHYPAAIEFLGNLTGFPERGKVMADRGRKILAEVDKAIGSLPESQKVRVYYAESSDGLTTECDESLHSDAIRRAGAKLVHECLQKNHMGMEKLTFQQVLAYNPDVILTQDPKFAEMAYADPAWKTIKAVADHRILVAPRTPFPWFDRPPAATRLIGISWLAARLYPQHYKIDLKQEMRELHKIFMGLDVADADLEAWMR